MKRFLLQSNTWLLALSLAMGSTAAHAQPVGPGGGAFWNQPLTDSWFNPFRWNGVLPWQGGVPIADVTAHISHPVQVDILGQGPQAVCHHLSLGQPGVILRIAGSSTIASLTVNGTQIDNFGRILVGGDDALQDSRFIINSNTNANGTGVLTLQAPVGHDAAILPTNNLGWLLVNWPDHTIEGNGTISVNLQNDGLIDANRNGRALTFTGAFTVQNNNMVRARNGGQIRLGISNGNFGFVQAGGELLIEPNSSLILESCGSNGLRGGLLHGGGTTTVNCQGFPIESVTIGSDMRVNFNGNSILEVRPLGIENNGLIQTGPTGQVRSQFGQSASLRGTGRLQLEGGGLGNFLNGAGYALINEPAHTIGGVGDIKVALTNRGTVQADRNGQTTGNSVLLLQQSTMINEGTFIARDTGVLNIEGITIDQTSSGQVRALAGSSVIMTASSPRIRGGSIATFGTSALVPQSNPAFIENVRIEAGSTVQIGCSIVLRMEGTIDQRGTMIINNDGCGPNFASLQGNGATQVIGAGEIRLRANSDFGNANLTGSGGLLSLGSSQMLTGYGNLLGAIRIDGALMPDQTFAPVGPVGKITVQPGGALTLGNDAQFIADLASISSFDRIAGTGTITIGGVLDVRLVGAYVPILGDSFDLITGSSISGQFRELRLPPAIANVDARVDVLADRVRLQFVAPPFKDGFE